jgi:hypothetical protein
MVVIADRAGRLGNKLLLSSHLVAASSKVGFRVMLPPFTGHYRWFQHLDALLPMYPSAGHWSMSLPGARFLLFHMARAIAAVMLRLRLPGNRFIRVVRLSEKDRLSLADPRVCEELATTRLVILQGWLLRDEVALEERRDEVRRALSPIPEILSVGHGRVEEARGDGQVVVGIHIRQGDYRKHLGGRFFFPTATYARMMEQILRIFPQDVRFLVATDSEQDWGLFSHLPYVRARGDALQDVFTLAACDFLFGPPSSFSLWASYYGDTPLCMMTSREQVIDIKDFVIAPEIRDPAVATLY